MEVMLGVERDLHSIGHDSCHAMIWSWRARAIQTPSHRGPAATLARQSTSLLSHLEQKWISFSRPTTRA